VLPAADQEILQSGNRSSYQGIALAISI